jgi:hypothetical protein
MNSIPVATSAPVLNAEPIVGGLVVRSPAEAVHLPTIADGCRQRIGQRLIYVQLRSSSRTLQQWLLALAVYQAVFALLVLAGIPAPFPGLGRTSLFALVVFLLLITPTAYFLGAFDQ